MRRWPYIAIPCIMLAVMAGLFYFNATKFSRNNSRAMVRPERTEERVITNASNVPRNSEAVWTQIKAGKGIDTWLLTYDGCQYIMVYSGSAMTMVKHEPK